MILLEWIVVDIIYIYIFLIKYTELSKVYSGHCLLFEVFYCLLIENINGFITRPHIRFLDVQDVKWDILF